MTGAEADAKWAKEKAALMDELTKLSDDDKRGLILQASNYRSGQDSVNSVYMGGMATSMMRHALGESGGAMLLAQRRKLSDLLLDASTPQLDKALDVCAWVIKYMREHPTVKCPCCGQITTPEKAEVWKTASPDEKFETFEHAFTEGSRHGDHLVAIRAMLYAMGRLLVWHVQRQLSRGA